MTQETATVQAGLIQLDNVVRFSADADWQKVTRVKAGHIQHGQEALSGSASSEPHITPAQLRPSVEITLQNGEHRNLLIGDDIEAQYECVHTFLIKLGEVVKVPGGEAWAKITQILDGETGGGKGISATRFYTTTDYASIDEFKFRSLFHKPHHTGDLENEELCRLIRKE